jgi:hypothetical protein
MGARHRRPEVDTSPRHRAPEFQAVRYDDAVRAVRASRSNGRARDGVATASRERRGRRAKGRGTAAADAAPAVAGDDVGHEALGYNWIWKRGWRLDKTTANRLAYQMKTRAISVILASLGLQLSGLLSSKIWIIAMAITAAGANWVAEYFKHQLGSKGLAITFGFRWRGALFVTPWLVATPRK